MNIKRILSPHLKEVRIHDWWVKTRVWKCSQSCGKEWSSPCCFLFSMYNVLIIAFFNVEVGFSMLEVPRLPFGGKFSSWCLFGGEQSAARLGYLKLPSKIGSDEGSYVQVSKLVVLRPYVRESPSPK